MIYISPADQKLIDEYKSAVARRAELDKISSIPKGMPPRPPIGGDSPHLEYYDFYDAYGHYAYTKHKPKVPELSEYLKRALAQPERLRCAIPTNMGSAIK